MTDKDTMPERIFITNDLEGGWEYSVYSEMRKFARNLGVEYVEYTRSDLCGVDALREIIEIYAGMDGFEPETAPEAYQQRIIEQMYEVAVRGNGDEL